jgi:hypothetical protein
MATSMAEIYFGDLPGVGWSQMDHDNAERGKMARVFYKMGHNQGAPGELQRALELISP